MINYKLDTITKQGKEFIAYVHVMDGDKILDAVSLVYKNEEDFKKILNLKTTKVKAAHDEREIKKAEVEKILGNINRKVIL